MKITTNENSITIRLDDEYDCDNFNGAVESDFPDIEKMFRRLSAL